MPVGWWVLEGPPLQRDAVKHGNGFNVPGCRHRHNMEGNDNNINILQDGMPMGKWVLKGLLLQRDIVRCGHGFDVPGCRGMCNMEGDNDNWDLWSAESVTTSASSWVSLPLVRV